MLATGPAAEAGAAAAGWPGTALAGSAWGGVLAAGPAAGEVGGLAPLAVASAGGAAGLWRLSRMMRVNVSVRTALSRMAVHAWPSGPCCGVCKPKKWPPVCTLRIQVGGHIPRTHCSLQVCKSWSAHDTRHACRNVLINLQKCCALGRKEVWTVQRQAVGTSIAGLLGHMHACPTLPGPAETPGPSGAKGVLLPSRAVPAPPYQCQSVEPASPSWVSGPTP